MYGKKIWNLKIPPKLKRFFWKGCKGALLILEELRKKKVPIDTNVGYPFKKDPTKIWDKLSYRNQVNQDSFIFLHVMSI